MLRLYSGSNSNSFPPFRWLEYSIQQSSSYWSARTYTASEKVTVHLAVKVVGLQIMKFVAKKIIQSTEPLVLESVASMKTHPNLYCTKTLFS